MNCAKHEAELQASQERVRDLERELASVLSGKDALAKKLCDAARLPLMPLSKAVDQIIADATRLARANARQRDEVGDALRELGMFKGIADGLRNENTRLLGLLARALPLLQTTPIGDLSLVREVAALRVTCEHCPEYAHPLNDDGTVCKRPRAASEKPSDRKPECSAECAATHVGRDHNSHFRAAEMPKRSA